VIQGRSESRYLIVVFAVTISVSFQLLVYLGVWGEGAGTFENRRKYKKAGKGAPSKREKSPRDPCLPD
jgi:hypothetical protein